MATRGMKTLLSPLFRVAATVPHSLAEVTVRMACSAGTENYIRGRIDFWGRVSEVGDNFLWDFCPVLHGIPHIEPILKKPRNNGDSFVIVHCE